LGFVWLQEGKKNLFLISMTGVFALKWFLVIPLLPFLYKKNIKIFLKLVLWMAVSNVLALLTVPGGFLTNIKSIISTQLGYTDEWAIPWLMEGTSVASSVSRVHEYIYGPAETIIFLSNNLNLLKVLSILYLLIALAIASSAKLPFWVRFYFALSTITFDTFETGWYAQMWVSFALMVWFFDKSPGRDDHKLVEISLKVSALFMLIPLWISIPINDVTRFNSHLLIPPILALFSGLLTIKNLIRK
jgi:hypothetical protein